MARRIDQYNARTILADCGIYRDADGHYPNFYSLNTDKKTSILEVASERKYRKPKNANGSRARYFYEYVRRSAK